MSQRGLCGAQSHSAVTAESPGSPVNLSASVSGTCSSASFGCSPRGGRVKVPLTATTSRSAPLGSRPSAQPAAIAVALTRFKMLLFPSVDVDRGPFDAMDARRSAREIAAADQHLAGACERDAGAPAFEHDLLLGLEHQPLAVELGEARAARHRLAPSAAPAHPPP